MSNLLSKYLLSFYLFSTLVAYAFFNVEIMVGALLFGIYLLVRGVQSGILSKKKSDLSPSILMLNIIILLVLSPLALWKSLPSLYFIFSSIAGILLAYMFSWRIEDVYFSLRLILIIVISSLLVYAVLNYPDNAFPFEDFLKGSGSSNVVTSFLILIQCSYSVVVFIYLRKLSWVTLLFTTVICFMAYGRGSIVASFLLIFLFIVVWLFLRRLSFGGLARVALMILFLVITYLIFGDEIYEFMLANTKLGSGFVDDSRLSMIDDYLASLNGISIVTGSSYEGTVINKYFDGNPHNSFIRAHHMLGIFYVVFLLSLMVFAVVVQRRFLNFIFIGGVLLIMMFRAFSEPVIFLTPLDFYFYIVMFCAFNVGNAEAKSDGFKSKG